MYKPVAENLNKTVELITSFGGYNKNFKILENEFSDELNITGDFSPVAFL